MQPQALYRAPAIFHLTICPPSQTFTNKLLGSPTNLYGTWGTGLYNGLVPSTMVTTTARDSSHSPLPIPTHIVRIQLQLDRDKGNIFIKLKTSAARSGRGSLRSSITEEGD